MRQLERLALFPIGSSVDGAGHLVIGGCAVPDLAARFGTPLYVYDESTIRSAIAGFRSEFGRRYPERVTILYACKAFLNRALLELMKDEGVGLDVVSGGEISIARACGFLMSAVSFPGNNKSGDELDLALECGVGRIVVDNFDELRMLADAAARKRTTASVLLRISPGIDPHTHRYESTGNVDSKFGFPLTRAEDALTEAMGESWLDVRGLHFHVGSQLTDPQPYREAIGVVLGLAARMAEKHGFIMQELSVGGGFPARYTLDSPVPPLSDYAEAIAGCIVERCRDLGLRVPRLSLEPGRSLVARAGVAVYSVGTKKEVPGVRTYVSVDGGIGDNVAPALYQTKMEAVLANRMNDETKGAFTIAGKFCESGDILARDVEMPEMVAGDILAMPTAGAYSIPQSSNYNAFLRPAVVMVRDGQARLIKRRETIEDLMACDM